MRTKGSPIDILKSNLVGRRLVSFEFQERKPEYSQTIGHTITDIHLGSDGDGAMLLHMDDGAVCEVYYNESICTDEVTE